MICRKMQEKQRIRGSEDTDETEENKLIQNIELDMFLYQGYLGRIIGFLTSE